MSDTNNYNNNFSIRKIAIPAFGPSLMYGIAEGAVLPVIAILARELGATLSIAALMVGLISLGSLIFNIPGSILIAKFGERRSIITASVWSALGFNICMFTQNLLLLAVGCIMIGISQAIFNIARQSYIAASVPLTYRARAMSTLGGVMRIGMFIGPFLGAFAIYLWGMKGSFFVGIFGVLCAAAVAAKFKEFDSSQIQSKINKPHNISISAIFLQHKKIFFTLGIGVLLVSAVRSSRQVIIPLWSDYLLLEPAVASLIFGIAGAVDMLVFYPAGKLMDAKGRRWIAIPSMLVMGSALLLITLTTDFYSLLLVSILLGFGNGIGSGLIMTLGADNAPAHYRAKFLGVWRISADMGSVSAPLLLSYLIAILSLPLGISIIGIIAYVAAVLLARWIPK